MTVGSRDLRDFVDALNRVGAEAGGKAVLIQQAQDLLKWEDDRFWEVAEEAQTQKLIDIRGGPGFVTLTLWGARLLESVERDPLSDPAQLSHRLRDMNDPAFAEIEKVVAAERERRGAGS